MATIIIKHPDLSVRGFSTVYKKAIDDSFLRHRRRHMAGHFLRLALSRYPAEYRKHKGVRRNFQKSPLVKTGLLRFRTLRGPVNLSGSVRVRRMIFTGLPRYAYMYKRGGFNKVEALEAMTQSEHIAFARNIEIVSEKLMQQKQGG